VKNLSNVAVLALSLGAVGWLAASEQPVKSDIDTRWPVPVKVVPTKTATATPPVIAPEKTMDELKADLAKAKQQAADADKARQEAEQQAVSLKKQVDDANAAVSKSAAEITRLNAVVSDVTSRVNPALPGSPVSYGASSYLSLADRSAGVFRLDTPAPGQVIPEKNDVVSVIFKSSAEATGPTMPNPAVNQMIGLLVFLNDQHIVLAQSHGMVNGVACWTNLTSIPLGSVDNVYVLNRSRNVSFPPVNTILPTDPRFTR